MSDDKKQNDLKWGLEVLEVYNALGKLPGSRHFSTPSAEYLFNHVTMTGDLDKFITQTVPKAAEMVVKHRAPVLDEQVIEIDRKSIADLQSRLAVCLAEEVVTLTPETVAPDANILDILGF